MPNNLVQSDLINRVTRKNVLERVTNYVIHTVMSAEDFPLIALTETTKDYVIKVEADAPRFVKNDTENRRTFSRERSFHIVPRYLRVNFRRLRKSLQCLSCVRAEEEVVIVDMPRHKSVDIGVGLARRMSLFLFTRKSVCTHPYHPFTPPQSTRKIYFMSDDRH